MTGDENKKIAVSYNLNLPVEIIFRDGTGIINYLYDASGKKLQKTVTQGGTVTETDYLSGFQYVSKTLDFFPTAEGYVKTVNGHGVISYRYVFNFTDHLGNIRMSYGYDPVSDGVVIMEENHNYPFGMKHEKYNSDQYEFVPTGEGSEYAVGISPLGPTDRKTYQYKYNGKEYQDELGLNIYDYGWRQYDPAIGRFNRIDRFAEKYHEFSPYDYAGNNPVVFVDIQGDSLFVGQQYRNGVNKILEESFGANASKFSYSKNGGLVFNGKTKDLSKGERAAFAELNKLMTSSTSYDVIIEENIEITKTDGTKKIVNTGQNGTMGDAAIYPSATKDGRGILALNPNSQNIQVPVLDVKYDANGNQLPANFADMSVNGGRGPNRSFSMYENFWHGIGHLVGGPGKDGNAMQVENLGGAIRKNVSTDASGTKTYVPASIAAKAYNMNHPKN